MTMKLIPSRILIALFISIVSFMGVYIHHNYLVKKVGGTITINHYESNSDLMIRTLCDPSKNNTVIIEGKDACRELNQ